VKQALRDRFSVLGQHYDMVRADINALHRIPCPKAFARGKDKCLKRWEKAGVRQSFLTAWKLTYHLTDWSVSSLPAGLPSTNNPLEGQFSGIKRTWTRHVMQPLSKFIDTVELMLFSWSKEKTTACTGLFPNDDQRAAISSAQADDFFQALGEDRPWVRCRRENGVSKKITQQQARKVLIQYNTGSDQLMDLVKTHTVFTKEKCTCEYYWEYGICWHMWWARGELDWNPAKLKELRKKGYVQVPKLGRKRPKPCRVADEGAAVQLQGPRKARVA